MADDADRISADDVVEQAPGDDASEAYVASPQSAGSKRRYVAAFGITVAVVIVALGRLSTAFTTCSPARRSMSTRPLAPTRPSSTSP